MNCPNCKHPNSDTARFCENCGQKLTLACPNCGNPVSATAKFCGNCGFALAAEAAPAEDPLIGRLKKLVPREFADRLLSSRGGRVEGERRVVTILFSDVKGSTSLGEERDPEEVLEIMNGAFDALIEPIYRYEGTLARLMGDAILAFFGAPIAHEDDAVRAVLAAQAIQAQMAEYAATVEKKFGVQGFGVRVGINTGLVVVGEVGSDLRVEYTAMGDAINLASRLEGAAEPGMIVVSEHTARLVRYAFELESLGELVLKGKFEPVLAHRVVARKAVPETARGIAGLHSPLVGRETEMEALRSKVRGLRQGLGQIVSIIGEAGLGKSRLMAELREWATADGRTPAVQWFDGRSLSYETSTPYAPFVELFRNMFRLREAGTPDEQYEFVRGQAVERFPERADQIAPFIGALLELPLSGEDAERVRYLEPPQLRGRVFQAVMELVEGLASERPLLLTFEDLHWIDPTSLDLLEQLFALTDRAPLMLLALFRPQRQDASWRFHEIASRDFGHRYSALFLEPLDERHSRQLVANLLEIEDLPEKVRALILSKAEGNPFFVEEVIRSLLDAKLVVRDGDHWRATREIENIAVPGTLAGVITARLDRLEDDSKRAAQTAAVVGRVFEYGVLSELYEPRPALGPALGDLQRRELVRERGRVPELAYAFKHALTQETAYASLLMSRRRELHRRTAECLERTAPDRVADIARHFVDARLESRALPYLVESGDRAARANAAAEAMGYYTKALEILNVVEGPSLARRAYEGLGGVLTITSNFPRAAETFRAMLAYAQGIGDVPMQVSALNKLANAVMWLGQFAETEARLTEAERLAREYEDRGGLAEMLMMRCGICTMSANFDDAMHYLGESVRVGQELNVKEQQAFGLTHLANTLVFMARFDDAWQKVHEALAVSEAIGDKKHIGEALAFAVPIGHLRRGDLDAARQAAERALEIGALISNLNILADGNYVLAELARARGDYPSAMVLYRRSLEAARQMGMPFMEVIPLAGLGSVSQAIGGPFAREAAQHHARALDLLSNPAGMAAGGTGWAEVGFRLLASGDVGGAAEMFEKGLTVPTMMGTLEMPYHHIGAARVALARGDAAGAESHLAQARTLVESRGMRHRMPLVELTDGRVRSARGEADGALEAFARAEALAAPMGMRPVILEARTEAARWLASLGREAEAEVKRREARAMVEEIAGLFEDPEMRREYLENAARAEGLVLSEAEGRRAGQPA